MLNIIALTAIIAVGGGPRSPRPWGGPGLHGLLHNPVVQQEIELSDEQVDQIIKIIDKYAEQRVKLQNEMRENAVKLRSLWYDPLKNKKRIEALVKRNNELRAQLSLLRMDERMEIWGVLTKEQQDKLWKMARFGWRCPQHLWRHGWPPPETPESYR